jgi:hypothetical protein
VVVGHTTDECFVGGLCSWVEHQPNAARVGLNLFFVGVVDRDGWELGTLLGPEESGHAHPIEFEHPDTGVVLLGGVLWCPGFLCRAGHPHTGHTGFRVCVVFGGVCGWCLVVV